MKLFVTGGLGFIGSNFIRYWLNTHPQDKIINFDLQTYAGHQESLRDIEKNSSYTYVKGDIRNLSEVEGAISDSEIIVHFAAETHVDRSILDPSVFVTTNILGTENLLEVAKKRQLRFHHISTDEVFGSLLNSDAKFSEATPYDPRSPYSASKASSDHLVRAYYHTFGLQATISNCSNNFGPYQDPEKFIPRLVTNLLLGEKAKVYGTGQNIRDWLYVEDHCRAIDMIINKGKIGDTYLIGGMTTDVTNLELTKLVIKHLHLSDESIEFVTDRPGHDHRYAVNWSKIKTELGWEPVFDFENRLKTTIDWYKDNEWWWKDIKNASESIYTK